MRPLWAPAESGAKEGNSAGEEPGEAGGHGALTNVSGGPISVEERVQTCVHEPTPIHSSTSLWRSQEEVTHITTPLLSARKKNIP